MTRGEDLRAAVFKFTKQCNTHVGIRCIPETNVKSKNLNSTL